MTYMSGIGFVLLTTFLASTVEAIEMVTIVVGVGATRGWRATLIGAGSGFVLLAVVVAVFGLALSAIPIGPLRLIVGALLLVFGLQWFRKGVTRVAAHGLAGTTAGHADEELAWTGPGFDWTAFVLAFKGVVLEGLEVAFIVVTFGAAGGQLVPAAIGAGLAGIGVLSVGAAIRQPLARLPENQMKFAVGLMLVSFGTFWAGEGIGIAWIGSDLAILLLAAGYLVTSLLAVRIVAARLARLGRVSPAGALEGSN
jgi:uncharacterized membrane protein